MCAPGFGGPLFTKAARLCASRPGHMCMGGGCLGAAPEGETFQARWRKQQRKKVMG